MKNKIIKKLQILEPRLLEVIDVSYQHKGHKGWQEGGETHFELTISSLKLDSLSRIDRHKLVYKILMDEMKQIHALQIFFK
jgi:BolA family transcriptional regulator, general stress-responsive regulator